MASRWEIPRSPYLDASALVKIYVQEAGSEQLNTSLRGRRDLQVSDLGVTELISAVARRRREKPLSADTAARLQNAVLADLASSFFEKVLPLDSQTHRQAERLLLSSSIPLRTLDALHLALAMSAAALCIVTFDVCLARAAREIGLRAIPESTR